VRIVSSCFPASSFFEFIEVSAVVRLEMTTALKMSPKNIEKVVTQFSAVVTGMTSYGTVEVTMLAPHRKAWEYLTPKSPCSLSHVGTCQ
jgi:hypothetical protein